eukprot:Lithocolla_globosa_v1_NODE_702_length_3415_cov_5.136607.p2 type:complete len:283 gc:universal NODE_702_length_3415_cov_5.136607:938-90(-)
MKGHQEGDGLIARFSFLWDHEVTITSRMKADMEKIIEVITFEEIAKEINDNYGNSARYQYHNDAAKEKFYQLEEKYVKNMQECEGVEIKRQIASRATYSMVVNTIAIIILQDSVARARARKIFHPPMIAPIIPDWTKTISDKAFEAGDLLTEAENHTKLIMYQGSLALEQGATNVVPSEFVDEVDGRNLVVKKILRMPNEKISKLHVVAASIHVCVGLTKTICEECVSNNVMELDINNRFRKRTWAQAQLSQDAVAYLQLHGVTQTSLDNNVYPLPLNVKRA